MVVDWNIIGSISLSIIIYLIGVGSGYLIRDRQKLDEWKEI
jgi:hypothetical protein